MSSIDALAIGSKRTTNRDMANPTICEATSAARSSGCGIPSVLTTRPSTSRAKNSFIMRAASSWLAADRISPTIVPPPDSEVQTPRAHNELRPASKVR
jgi:hypothetical protein